MSAYLDYHLRVLVNTLPTRDQLELWLTNPVLLADPDTARRIELTKEAMGGYSDRRCLQALLALKKRLSLLRNLTRCPPNALNDHDLSELLTHPLISPDERRQLSGKAWHPLEYKWEYERIMRVLKAREDAAWPDDTQQHTPEDIAA
jgi:hypothetical protein